MVVCVCGSVCVNLLSPSPFSSVHPPPRKQLLFLRRFSVGTRRSASAPVQNCGADRSMPLLLKQIRECTDPFQAAGTLRHFLAVGSATDILEQGPGGHPPRSHGMDPDPPGVLAECWTQMTGLVVAWLKGPEHAATLPDVLDAVVLVVCEALDVLPGQLLSFGIYETVISLATHLRNIVADLTHPLHGTAVAWVADSLSLCLRLFCGLGESRLKFNMEFVVRPEGLRLVDPRFAGFVTLQMKGHRATGDTVLGLCLQAMNHLGNLLVAPPVIAHAPNIRAAMRQSLVEDCARLCDHLKIANRMLTTPLVGLQLRTPPSAPATFTSSEGTAERFSKIGMSTETISKFQKMNMRMDQTHHLVAYKTSVVYFFGLLLPFLALYDDAVLHQSVAAVVDVLIYLDSRQDAACTVPGTFSSSFYATFEKEKLNDTRSYAAHFCNRIIPRLVKMVKKTMSPPAIQLLISTMSKLSYSTNFVMTIVTDLLSVGASSTFSPSVQLVAQGLFCLYRPLTGHFRGWLDHPETRQPLSTNPAVLEAMRNRHAQTVAQLLSILGAISITAPLALLPYRSFFAQLLFSPSLQGQAVAVSLLTIVSVLSRISDANAVFFLHVLFASLLTGSPIVNRDATIRPALAQCAASILRSYPVSILESPTENFEALLRLPPFEEFAAVSVDCAYVPCDGPLLLLDMCCRLQADNDPMIADIFRSILSRASQCGTGVAGGDGAAGTAPPSCENGLEKMDEETEIRLRRVERQLAMVSTLTVDEVLEIKRTVRQMAKQVEGVETLVAGVSESAEKQQIAVARVQASVERIDRQVESVQLDLSSIREHADYKPRKDGSGVDGGPNENDGSPMAATAEAKLVEDLRQTLQLQIAALREQLGRVATRLPVPYAISVKQSGFSTVTRPVVQLVFHCQCPCVHQETIRRADEEAAEAAADSEKDGTKQQPRHPQIKFRNACATPECPYSVGRKTFLVETKMWKKWLRVAVAAVGSAAAIASFDVAWAAQGLGKIYDLLKGPSDSSFLDFCRSLQLRDGVPLMTAEEQTQLVQALRGAGFEKEFSWDPALLCWTCQICKQHAATVKENQRRQKSFQSLASQLEVLRQQRTDVYNLLMKEFQTVERPFQTMVEKQGHVVKSWRQRCLYIDQEKVRYSVDPGSSPRKVFLVADIVRAGFFDKAAEEVLVHLQCPAGRPRDRTWFIETSLPSRWCLLMTSMTVGDATQGICYIESLKRLEANRLALNGLDLRIADLEAALAADQL